MNNNYIFYFSIIMNIYYYSKYNLLIHTKIKILLLSHTNYFHFNKIFLFHNI